MKLKLRDGVLLADVESGTAILDEKRGRYWNLNETGAQVLQTLLVGGTHEQAAEALARQFDVDLATARRDVQDLVERLCSAALVEYPRKRSGEAR